MSGGRNEIANLEKFAATYRVPLLDIQLMALNLYGIASDVGDGRARMEVRLDGDPATEWHVIVPTGQTSSPFELLRDALFLSGRHIASVRLIQHDDARLGYVRGGGRTLTLNTNKRSTCTGCVFCPNTLADANDPRIAHSDGDVGKWLSVFLLENGWSDISAVQEINVSTGCFAEESRALAHLTGLRTLLSDFRFRGRLGILSSVIRTDRALGALSSLGPFALFLTLECITRRSLLLKESKADLDPEEAIKILAHARAAGVDTGVMIVVGLDQLSEVVNWLRRVVPHLTDFPNLQIFQSHNPYMSLFRAKDAENLEFFLQARREFEDVLLSTQLRPRRWQNYRPLWHYAFGPEVLSLSL